MSEYRKFGRDIGLVGITRLLLGLRGLILLPILTKTLGPFDYGIWAQLAVTIALLPMLASLGLPGATLRFLSGEKNKKEIQEGFFSSLSVVFLSSLILSMLLYFSADSFALTFFHTPEASSLVKISAVILILCSLDGISLEFFRTFRQMKKYSLFTLLETFGTIGLIAYLILSGFGLFGAVTALLIARAAIFAAMFPTIISQIGVRFPRFTKIKSYLNYGLPLLPVGLFFMVVEYSDRYLIGFFMGPTSVGIYSAAYGIAHVVFMFSWPLTTVLSPTLFKFWDEGKNDELKKHFKYTLKGFLTFAIPAVFGITVLAAPLLQTLSTSDFVPGSSIMSILAIASFFLGFSTFPDHVFYLTKNTKQFAVLWGLLALINFVLNIILIPIIGIYGAAISTLICFITGALISSIIFSKKIKVVFDWTFIAKSIVASSIMAFVIWNVNLIKFPEIILSIFLGASIYFAALILLKGFRRREIMFIVNILKK